ncbi:hypothetical protein D1159_07535 [Pseudoflavonifractor sp. 524-17]|uniref:recombinase family protein n=1 Tax=Pseudoflavonifractor sp. 524-17 TaxID=2304577 RepID=UPI001379B30C|nr:hypothetical protein [Pseudoflavonifractor sp. 524-17]
MKVLMYLRISSEDTDMREKNKSESNSIAHQRWLLTDFVRNHPELCGAELDELCDDGWSGKNFERPGMTELLEQVRRGAVQCIVVKDFSRFGRDYLTVGNYISRVFPFMGVRFISVNDNFDSARPGDIDSLDTSFKTLIYDLYSRELSQKVKAARKQRAEQGLFLSPFAPYGYAKDGNDKNHLVIDESAAGVVRRIFRMTLDGDMPSQIAAALNREGVMTPMRYKHDTGISRKWPCIREDNFWTGGAVSIILRDERYIGTVIYGKRERKQIGHWDNKAVDKSDWIICEDQHEAIISKEDFDTVQSLLAQRPSKPYAPQTDRPLKRKVFCGMCGHTMRRDTKPYVQYRCRTHSYTDEYVCTGHGIDEADILGAIEDAVRIYARLAVRLDQMNAVRQERSRREKKESSKKLFALQNEKLRLDSRLQELYESFFSGEISREKYLAQKSSITEREQEIAAETGRLEQAVAEAAGGQSEAIAKYIGYAELDELTADILDELVKRVTVYPGDVLEVKLNLTDELEKLADDLQAG